MGEYISRDAVLTVLDWDCASQGALDAIKAIPAADVVEVVRCGECIRKDICRTSNVWAVSPDDNWFCADGEHKGGQDDV